MAQSGAIISSMQMNYMHSTWQTEMLHCLAPRLICFIRATLEKECFPDKRFNVQVYGSLHHGLFVPGTSKINVDISPPDDKAWSGENIYNGMVLRVLASKLQSSTEQKSTVQNPILVWHRTAQRPWMVLFTWDGIPVHVTYCNAAGVHVSHFMGRILKECPYLRLTLFHWKEHLRPVRGIQYIGPNGGQVSAYTLFTTRCGHIKELMVSLNVNMFEQRARQITISHIFTIPDKVATPDVVLSDQRNLMSRCFLAKDMAQLLVALPPLVA